MKNFSIHSFKKCLFFVFCLFWFLLLSNNTVHVIFYTYICYWNTFQYKHNNLTISCAIDFKRYHIIFIILFLCLFLLCLDFVLFYKALLWSSQSHQRACVLKWYIIQCLIYFGFVECLCMDFLKNNLTSRQSNRKLKLQSCKLYDNKYMITST